MVKHLLGIIKYVIGPKINVKVSIFKFKIINDTKWWKSWHLFFFWNAFHWKKFNASHFEILFWFYSGLFVYLFIEIIVIIFSSSFFHFICVKNVVLSFQKSIMNAFYFKNSSICFLIQFSLNFIATQIIWNQIMLLLNIALHF